MRNPRSMLLFLILALTLALVPFGRAQQGADLTGAWLATDVTYPPWTFDLKQNGAALTGRVWQNGAVQTVGQITDGKVTSEREITVLDGGAAASTVWARIRREARVGKLDYIFGECTHRLLPNRRHFATA